jgi:hypothetical protein
MSSEVLDGELLTDARDGIDEQQAYKFEEFRSSAAGQDSSLLITVYRQPSNPDGTAVANGKLQYMFQLPVDQLTREQILDKVSREYMADSDRYWYVRIHIRQPGKRGILFNELCTILKQPKLIDNSPSGQDASVLGAVGKMLADAQTRTDALFSRLLEAQKPVQQVNPIELFMLGQKQSAEMFKDIASAMRPASPGIAGTPGEGGLEGLLKQIMVMKQISEFMGGGVGAAAAAGGSGSDIAEIIKAVGPIAAPFMSIVAAQLAARTGKTPPPNQPRLAAPNPADVPTPAPGAASAQTPPAAESTAAPIAVKEQEPKRDMAKEDRMLFAMRDQLGQLADAIALNPPIESVGAQILEHLPEEYDETFYTVLAQENWFERLSAVQNKLQPHKEWLSKLRDYIIASYTTDEGDAANDAPGG